MNQKSKAVALAVTLLLASNVTFGAIVYDNTTTDLGQYYSSTNEFGDQVDLGGTDRSLTQFSFYAFSPSSGLGYTLRFYANDGLGGAPGTLLYDGSIDPPQPLASGYQTYTVTFPSLTVPNSLTWTIQFSGANAGLLVYNPPTVGSSLNDFWEEVGGSAWSLLQITGGVPTANFAARFTAVPEPGVLALGALGILAWAGFRRSRQTKG